MTAGARHEAQPEVDGKADYEVEEQTGVQLKRPVPPPLGQARGEQQKVKRVPGEHRCQSAQ